MKPQALTLTAPERDLLVAALRWSAVRWSKDPLNESRRETAAWLERLPAKKQRVAMTDEGMMQAGDSLTFYVVANNAVTTEALNLLTKLHGAVSVQARIARNLELAREKLEGGRR